MLEITFFKWVKKQFYYTRKCKTEAFRDPMSL